MKYILRKSEDRIHKKDEWKTSAYAFVPFQTNFGELCGFADDIVQPGKGFGMHPHKNMEISTIVIDGAQSHKDDTGSEGIVDAKCVQTMSAGTGIMHSEYNASATESFHSFQIWVYPKELNVLPRHEKFVFDPKDKKNRVLLALSPDGRNNTAKINQDAFFSLSELEKDMKVNYTMNMSNNGVYIHCAKGTVNIEDNLIHEGDAIGIYETSAISILALQNAELIFVEVPMQRGIKL
ncbi:MAG: pirin family protein [Bacteroidota bacterium]|nr:pirin family protein [Bacteroidota bacterium]